MNYRLIIIFFFGMNAVSSMAQRVGWHELTADFLLNSSRYYAFGGPIISSQEGFFEKTSILFGWQQVFLKRAKWQYRFGAKIGYSQFEATCDCTQWPSEHDAQNPGFYLRDPNLDDHFRLPVFSVELPISIRRLKTTIPQLPFVELGLIPAIGLMREQFKKFGNAGLLVNPFHLAARIGGGVHLSSRLTITVSIKSWLTDFEFKYRPAAVPLIYARRTSFGLETAFRL